MGRNSGRIPRAVAWLAASCMGLVPGPSPAQESEPRATLVRQGELVRSVAFSPDGKTLASATDGGGRSSSGT